MSTENTQPTSEPKPSQPTPESHHATDEDVNRLFAAATPDKPRPKIQAAPAEIDERQADAIEDCKRRAWLVFGMLVSRDILPLPGTNEANDTDVVIDALFSALMLDAESWVPWGF